MCTVINQTTARKLAEASSAIADGQQLQRDGNPNAAKRYRCAVTWYNQLLGEDSSLQLKRSVLKGLIEAHSGLALTTDNGTGEPDHQALAADYTSQLATVEQDLSTAYAAYTEQDETSGLS
jgi:hypothetical protein